VSQLIKNKKIVVILPAYRAVKTLEKTLDDIPMQWVDDIILVDDASGDGTAELSRKLGLKTFVHTQNSGYGANQKTCYREALKLGADIIVMIHPDHQYDPKVIPDMVSLFADGKTDAVFGSRMMHYKNALGGGMPYWKFAANIFLTKIENLILNLNLTEYHSGLRAYSSKVLQRLPLNENSDDFVFDTEIIVQMKIFGLSRIKEIPIPTKYFPEASMIGFWRSTKYGFAILNVLIKYLFFKSGIKNYEQFK
jgi:glycosyltransferase involved in cell wall biosynthesis